jgi:hypothetical protein
MTNKPTRAPAKKKQPAATQTSESIAEQTRIFLESGKKIQYIKPGISGQQSPAAKKQAAAAPAATPDPAPVTEDKEKSS